MTNYQILSLLLIAAGAIVMSISIIKYHATIRLAQSFITRGRSSATRWYKIHHLFMFFFLFGYIAVLFSIANNIQFVSELFTSIIFFFGAGFVLIGILLQSRMLRSIKKKHVKLLEKNLQLHQVEDATIYALAYLAEIRDWETGQHLDRTSQYVSILAEELSKLPKYKLHLTPSYREDIVKSAPLHDIGKVGVPDSILKKTGKLTTEEFDQIKLHCEYGANVLKIAEKKVNFQSFLTLAIQLVMFHHERWDGKGYPKGLKGDDIPLSAQIMALADVYDALRSKRCYKDGYSHAHSSEIIEKERGKHFSPDIVDAFIKTKDIFQKISETSSD